MASSSDRKKSVRVLVAEDSPTSRRLLCEVLQMDPEIVVAGEATNGVEAVDLASRLQPDVITMDVTMPEMDGFEAMRRILAERAVPVVIITSHADAGELEFSMQALRAGALTVVPRPPGPDADDFEHVVRAIQRTVKQVARARAVMPRAQERKPLTRFPPFAAQVRPYPTPRILAIAASAGGPPALASLLAGLAGCKVPVVIVQHISEGFVTGLASWLSASARMPVQVVTAGASLVAGTAYVAADGAHLMVTKTGHAKLDSAKGGRFKPSADVLFGSVAEACGSAAVGAILTGMGNDGTLGARAIREAGGRVVVQDPSTAAVSGMPESAVEAGVASAVMPLEGIAPYIRGLWK